MKFTSKTYKWLIRRSNFRIRVLFWFGKRGHNTPEMIRRIDRERVLLSRIIKHIVREMG